MKDLRKRLLFTILSGIGLFVGGVSGAYGQTAKDNPGPLKTLTGRIRWDKAMGVLPTEPRGRTAVENICSQFFVVAVRHETGVKPIQYDIALVAKPEASKPNHYSCQFEMQVPSGVTLTVYPGMGDGLKWPETAKTRFHYSDPWIDSGRPVRLAPRIFKPNGRVVRLEKQSMYISFDLVYEM